MQHTSAIPQTTLTIEAVHLCYATFKLHICVILHRVITIEVMHLFSAAQNYNYSSHKCFLLHRDINIQVVYLFSTKQRHNYSSRTSIF